MFGLLLLNKELDEGKWGGNVWNPWVLLSVLLLQVLLGEDSDGGVVIEVNLVGDVHHCFRLPASSHKDESQGLSSAGQACCFAFQ